jgi:hypothetical protein
MFGPSTTSARIRRAADIAYRLDSQFAQKFAAATDDDPARAKARTVMQQELSAIADSQKIGNEGWLSDDDAKSANASWSALARRNAKGVSHLGKQDIWALIERAAGVPLRLSFPMLNLAFATAEQFYSGSNDSARYLRAMFAGAIEATRVARNLATGSRRSVSVRPLGASSTSRLVGAGQRAAALEWLEEWCAAEAKESLVMCDPYFGLEDLEAIKLVQSVAGNIRIQVITSKKALRNVASPHDETFRRYWRQNISTVDPPRTEIMSIGVGELGISPIHDRWWIAAKSVLHFGTSFSGLGKRDSEILLEGEASDVRSLVTSYLSRERIRHDEHRIEYTMFSI